MLTRPRLGRDFPPGHAYTTFRNAMVDQLETQAVPDQQGEATYPLANIQLGSKDDLLAGLIGAWAAVGEVLAFYQDRIGNEGYVTTASEDRSVAELARSIGYEPLPCMSAQVPLAFTIGPSTGLDRLSVPVRTRVQSLPGPSTRPQVFETVESIEVRTEWSDMLPARPSMSTPALSVGATELFLGSAAPHLAVGDRLLIVEDSAPSTWYVRLVASVERQLTRMRVTWSDPLQPRAVVIPAVFALRTQAHLFGWDAPRWDSLPAAQKRRAAPLIGGVSFSADRGDTWTQAPAGGPPHDVRALAFDQHGTAFAATAGDGVMRSTDRGRGWEPANLGLTRRDGHALAVDAVGNLFVGTAYGGVFRSADSGASWEPFQFRAGVQLGRRGLGVATSRLPNTVVRAMTVYVEPGPATTTLLAGTDQGVYRTIAGGEGWEAANDGLPNDVAGSDATGVVVNAFALHPPTDHMYIATRRGVFSSTGRATRWSAASTGLSLNGGNPLPVSSLVAFADASNGRWTMLAATSAGVFRTNLPTVAWTAVDVAAAPGVMWNSLAATVEAQAPPVTTVYAGTSGGVLRSRDGGTTWQLAGTGFSSPDMRAVAADSRGGVLAAAPSTVGPGDEWPGFGIQGGQLHLDRTYPLVKPGGWLVAALADQSPSSAVALYSVTAVQRTHRADFGQRRFATTVTASGDAALTSLDRRQVLVLAGSERLPVAATEVATIVTGSGVALAAGLERPLEAGRLVALRGRRAGDRGAVGGDEVAEVVRVAETVADANEGTWLNFQSPLQHAYDAASLHMNANVAQATHGETITEVLGSGDYAQALQQFTLRRGPPTRYLGPGEAAVTLALDVAVNNVVWERVDSLLGRDGRSQAYVARQDASGVVTLTFGDGVNGARLPTGTENVVATYRAGAGTDGNLAADSLIQLLTRPLGVRRVTNPIPSSGGSEPETDADVRVQAPRALRHLRRVVSLADYAAFARDLPTIDKAVVRSLVIGHRRVVHLTIASAVGHASAPDVLEAVRAVHASHLEVEVDDCRRRPFNVGADLFLAPLADPVQVAHDARVALAQTFAFEARDLGQPVTASEVVQALQAVAGVVAVDLTALAYADAPTPASPRSSLAAQPAYFDASSARIVPAELLVLGSASLGTRPSP